MLQMDEHMTDTKYTSPQSVFLLDKPGMNHGSEPNRVETCGTLVK